MSSIDAGNDPERFWAVAVGDAERVAPRLGKPDISHPLSASRGVSAWWGDQAKLLTVAGDAERQVIVQGRIDGIDGAGDARTLLEAYAQRGLSCLESLRGPFCAVIADAATDSVACVRGPLGVQPLFYRERNGGLVFSPSPELLARCTNEPPVADRVALAEWVMKSTTSMDRTFYAGVTRVPPGHALVSSGAGNRLFRYWQPSLGGLVDPIGGAEALDRFDAAFDRAVARIAGGDRCAVFLSGGLDSSLTAAALARHHQKRGLAPPIAVSMKFSGSNEDETGLAGEVARTLGMSHLVYPLVDTSTGTGLLAAGIGASRRSWYPLLNPWNAAYERVASSLAEKGLAAGLRGEGGNDLLEPPWELAGDLLRRAQFGEVLRFVGSQPQCYGGRVRDYVRPVVWERGVVALAKPVAHRALLAVAPGRVARLRAERAGSAFQSWVLPDSELRAEVVANQVALQPLLDADDLYAYARFRLLDNTYNGITLENAYLRSRKSGLAEPSPYWDAGLYELVYALPAKALYLGGHAKGLALSSLARRVDRNLASRLGPSSAEATLSAAYADEAGTVIAQLGGFPRLSELGVVSSEGARSAADPAIAPGGKVDFQAWSLLSTEAWLQERSL